MSYKIAIVSSDNVVVDQTFGGADGFHIYQVEGREYSEVEFRRNQNLGADTGCQSQEGCNGSHSGCSHGEGKSESLSLVDDCRAVVCTKIGRHILKHLEGRAISAFDISCRVDEALDKIVDYYFKIDNRGFRVRG